MDTVDKIDELKIDELKRRNRYYYLKKIKGKISNFSSGTKYDKEILIFLENKKKLASEDLF